MNEPTEPTENTEPAELIARGTQVHAPDLDWSQIRETVLMLELSAGQIEAALKDSDNSVAVLTDSFTTIAGNMRVIAETVAELNGMTESRANDTKNHLQGVTQNVTGMVHQAIIAFQFYDRLVQRLAHVNHSLAALSNLVGDNSRLYNPLEWKGLQEKIRSKYTMVEEQAMFEAVMRGVGVKEALEHFMAEMKDRGTDEIELF